MGWFSSRVYVWCLFQGMCCFIWTCKNNTVLQWEALVKGPVKFDWFWDLVSRVVDDELEMVVIENTEEARVLPMDTLDHKM